MNFNPIFTERPLSWSQLSTFFYDKEQWRKRYLLEEKDPASPAMLFGKEIGDAIARGDNTAPCVPKQCRFEYELRAELDGISLVGYADSYCPHEYKLEEYKTSENETKWNQESADNHGQLTMYALLLLLQDKVIPEDITMRLSYIPVKTGQDFSLVVSGKTIVFNTKRTTKDVENFKKVIKNTIKQMESYAQNPVDVKRVVRI